MSTVTQSYFPAKSLPSHSGVSLSSLENFENDRVGRATMVPTTLSIPSTQTSPTDSQSPSLSSPTTPFSKSKFNLAWLKPRTQMPKHPSSGPDTTSEEFTVRVEPEFSVTCTVVRPLSRSRRTLNALFTGKRSGLASHAKVSRGSLSSIGWFPVLPVLGQSNDHVERETLSARPVEITVKVETVIVSRQK